MSNYFRLTLALALSLGAQGCGKNEPEDAAPRPVYTERVPAPRSERTRTFSGLTQTRVNSTLAFLVPGKIETLNVDIGMEIENAFVIATLEADDYNLQLQRADAQVTSANAERDKARLNYYRIQTLYEQDSVGQAQFDQALASWVATKAAAESAEKGRQLAQNQLDDTILKSPSKGVIGSKPVEEDQVVQAGQTIATLLTPDQLEVEIGVPEALINEIRVGMTGRFSPDTANGTAAFPVKVVRVGVIAGQTATYEVVLSIDSPNTGLRAGMAGQVELSFPLEEGDQYPTIAATALGGLQETNRYVWVVNSTAGGHQVERRAVQVGALVGSSNSAPPSLSSRSDLVGSRLQLIGGDLKTGDRIVVRGATKLLSGASVTLLDEEPVQ